VKKNLTNFNISTGTLSSGIYTVGGTLKFSGANIVNNAANLTISGTSAQILNGTTNGLANFVNNTGAFTVSANGNFTTGPSSFSNSGTVTVAAGSTMTVGGGNSYNQSAGTTTVDGTLGASAGINVTGGTVLGAGKLSGNATVGGSGTGPTLSVGDSGKAGLLAITGTYTQLSTGSISAFIGGTSVGTQYSQLQVGSSAMLAGTLNVTLASGFTPTIGSTFTVLTASSIAGTFSNSTISINGSEHFNVSYTSTGVVLTVASGNAPQSGGLAKSGVAVLPGNLLRFRVGGNHIPGARIRNSGARSSVAFPAETNLRRYSGSTRVVEVSRGPARIAQTWRKPTFTTPAGTKASVERVNVSNNWTAPMRAVSQRMPVGGISMQHVAVKVLQPTLPRFRR
jgi:hypothetical protein